MNNSSAATAFIIGLSLVVCTWMMSSAIKSFGASLERSAQMHRPFSVQIPSQFVVNLDGSLSGGNSPVRLDLKTTP